VEHQYLDNHDISGLLLEPTINLHTFIRTERLINIKLIARLPCVIRSQKQGCTRELIVICFIAHLGFGIEQVFALGKSQLHSHPHMQVEAHHGLEAGAHHKYFLLAVFLPRSLMQSPRHWVDSRRSYLNRCSCKTHVRWDL